MFRIVSIPVLPGSRKFSRRTKKWLIVIGSENRYGLTRPPTLATVVNKWLQYVDNVPGIVECKFLIPADVVRRILQLVKCNIYHGGRIFFPASEVFCQAVEKSWRELATLLDMFRKKKNPRKFCCSPHIASSTRSWSSHVLPFKNFQSKISFGKELIRFFVYQRRRNHYGSQFRGKHLYL